MSLKHLNVLFIVIIFFSSCTSYKTVPYFQDLQKDSIYKEQITNYTPATIQSGDLLRIHVTSLNHDADVEFNYNLERPNNANNMPDLNVFPGSSAAEPSSVIGYFVDHNGNIHLPLVDTLKLAGYSIDDAIIVVQNKLKDVLSKPVVTIQLENIKVSVLGDVTKPDTYFFQDEKITLNEALAYAGDLNVTGIRNNILLIREIGGKREYIPLDLTSKKIFNSPYYYLKNNDIIYVTPNRQKVSSSDVAIQRIAVIISALSLAIFLIRSK